jgi:hypothetical protein
MSEMSMILERLNSRLLWCKSFAESLFALALVGEPRNKKCLLPTDQGPLFRQILVGLA